MAFHSTDNEIHFVDQIGRAIVLSFPAKKIVSLVPSQTELLFDLGLEKEVIGITKFCIHPEKWRKQKSQIGGTKTPKIKEILDLKPDLIIANKEENTKEAIEELQKHCPVWVSDVKTLEEALEMIRHIGTMTMGSEKAKSLCQIIEANFDEYHQLRQLQKFKTAYLIWRNPWMTVGNDTFIHHLLDRIGLVNVFAEQERYPTTSIEALKEKQLDLLLLSSEPYPFKETHLLELKKHLPDTKILLVDGEMFSWYGSRLQYAPDYFAKIFS